MSGNALPRALLQLPISCANGRHVPQLQRLTFKCCKSQRDSAGVRDYIEKYLVDFARSNPSTAIYVKPRRHKPPLIVAEYLCGNWQYVKPKFMSSDEIYCWVNFLRTRSGVDIFPIYKYWSTKNPSIQGLWHPFYNFQQDDIKYASPDEILRNFQDLSKFDGECSSAENELLDKSSKQKLRINP